MTGHEQQPPVNRQQEKWNEIYRERSLRCPPEPAYVLQNHDYLLPSRGSAVDLACGTGGNALFLAKRGLQTQAWDFSPVALDRLARFAEQQGLAVDCEVRDLEKAELPRGCWDVIVITRYLDRGLNAQVVEALRPGGLLYYQSFLSVKDPSIGPRSPEYLLAENELLRMFSGLVIRAYSEAGRKGDLSKGFRNEAFLVAEKPRPPSGSKI